MRTQNTRLRRIRHALGLDGQCRDCTRPWKELRFLDDPPMPPCPTCGRGPDEVRFIQEVVVESRGHLEQLRAEGLA